MSCTTCGGPTEGYICTACGMDVKQPVEQHNCGAENCRPKCSGCGMAEDACTCS